MTRKVKVDTPNLQIVHLYFCVTQIPHYTIQLTTRIPRTQKQVIFLSSLGIHLKVPVARDVLQWLAKKTGDLDNLPYKPGISN